MSIHIYWKGPFDEYVWDLRNGPVRITDKGVQGFGIGPTDAFTRASSFTAGQSLLGTRALPRDITLPVIVNHSLPRDQWQDWDRKWWRSFDSEIPGTLYVTDERGSTRTLQCRFEDDGDYEFDFDPSDMGMTAVVMSLVADDPWFRGEPVRFVVDPPPDPIPFFGPEGQPGEDRPAGPPFYVTSSGTRGLKQLTNPGDVAAWPIWNVYGPAVSFRLVVDGAVISSTTIEVPIGYRLEIDSRPFRKTVRLYSPSGSFETVTRLLDASGMNFAPIPARDSVYVQILASGGGRASVEFDPLYRRAF